MTDIYTWIEVHPDHLPKVGEKVFIVEDLRGSPDEFQRRAFNKVVDSNPTIGHIPMGNNQYFDLFPKYADDMVFVKYGTVTERYPDCFILKTDKGTTVYPEHITHWLPKPTFVAPVLTQDEADARFEARVQSLKRVDKELNWSHNELMQYQKEHSV